MESLTILLNSSKSARISRDGAKYCQTDLRARTKGQVSENPAYDSEAAEDKLSIPYSRNWDMAFLLRIIRLCALPERTLPSQEVC